MRDKDVKFIHIISIVTAVYNNGINLKIQMSHQRHLTTTFKLPHVWHLLSMSGLARDSPQISARPHQLDLAPYASGPYNAQWNAPGLLHDKHTLRSVTTYPSVGGLHEAHGCVFQERNTLGVATIIYLRKTSKKPEKTWSMNFKWKVRELYLRTGKVLAPDMSVTRDDSL